MTSDLGLSNFRVQGCPLAGKRRAVRDDDPAASKISSHLEKRSKREQPAASKFVKENQQFVFNCGSAVSTRKQLSKNTVSQLIRASRVKSDSLGNCDAGKEGDNKEEQGTDMTSKTFVRKNTRALTSLGKIVKGKGSLVQRGPGRLVRGGKKKEVTVASVDAKNEPTPLSLTSGEFVETTKDDAGEVKEIESEGGKFGEIPEENPLKVLGIGTDKVDVDGPSVDSKSEMEDGDSTDLDEEKRTIRETERALRSLSGEWEEDGSSFFRFKDKVSSDGTNPKKSSNVQKKRVQAAAEVLVDCESPDMDPPAKLGLSGDDTLEVVAENETVQEVDGSSAEDKLEISISENVENEILVTETTMSCSEEEMTEEVLAPLEVVVGGSNEDDDVENLLRIEQQCATIQSLVARQSLEDPLDEEIDECDGKADRLYESDHDEVALHESAAVSHNCIALLSPVFSVEVTIDSSKDASTSESVGEKLCSCEPSEMLDPACNDEHESFAMSECSNEVLDQESVVETGIGDDKNFMKLVVIAPLSPSYEPMQDTADAAEESGIHDGEVAEVEKPVKFIRPKLEPVEPEWSEMDVVETCIVSTNVATVITESKILTQEVTNTEPVSTSDSADAPAAVTVALTSVTPAVGTESAGERKISETLALPMRDGGGLTQPQMDARLRIMKQNFPAPVVVQVSLGHGVSHPSQFAPSFQLHHIQSPQQLQQLQQSLQQHYQLPAAAVQSLSQTLAVQKLANSSTQQLVVAPQQFAITPQQLAASPQQLTVSLQQLGVSPQQLHQQLKVSPHHQQLIVSQLSQQLSQQVTSVASSQQQVNLVTAGTQQHPLGITSISAQHLQQAGIGAITPGLGAATQKLGLLATPQQLLRMAGVSQHLASSSGTASTPAVVPASASHQTPIGLVSSLQMITAAQEQLRLAGGPQQTLAPQISTATTASAPSAQQVLSISNALQQFVLPNASPQQQLRMVTAPLRMITSQQPLGSATTMQQLMQAISIQQMQLSLNQQLSSAQQVVLSPVQATQAPSSVIPCKFPGSPSPRPNAKPVLEQPQVIPSAAAKENSGEMLPPPSVPPSANTPTILAKMSPKDIALKGLQELTQFPIDC